MLVEWAGPPGKQNAGCAWCGGWAGAEAIRRRFTRHTQPGAYPLVLLALGCGWLVPVYLPPGPGERHWRARKGKPAPTASCKATCKAGAGGRADDAPAPVRAAGPPASLARHLALGGQRKGPLCRGPWALQGGPFPQRARAPCSGRRLSMPDQATCRITYAIPIFCNFCKLLR